MDTSKGKLNIVSEFNPQINAIKLTDWGIVIKHMFPFYVIDDFFLIGQKLQKQHNCIPDEHYVPTLIAVSKESI